MSESVSWFRLYHSFLDHSKTGTLPVLDRGYWLTLAILASRNNPRGLIPPVSILKRYMGESNASHPKRITAILERFYRLTLLDKRDGQYYLHNFGSRQWIPDGEKGEEKPVFRQEPDRSPTLSRDGLSEAAIENKRVTGKNYTETAVTDTDTEYIGGLRTAIMLFNAHIAAIRLRSGSSHQALADRAQSPSASHNNQGRIVHGSAGEGVGGSRTSKARTVPQNSLPGMGRSSFDAAFGETWALWQALPGIARHKRFADTDRQAFRRTWALLGGDAQALDDIHSAIKRYSAWSVGAKAGRYRPAYRWTFVEFIRHKRGSLIQRLASDSWELTCEPFTQAVSRPDRSVASLLASASRLASEGGA